MAQLSKTAFEAKFTDDVTGEFPTNTTQAIGSVNMRNLADDLADSVLFLSDHVEVSPITYPGVSTKVPSSLATGTYYKRTDISSASMLNAGAGSTPVTCVAAPASGYMIVPVAFHIGMDYNSAAYATNTTFRFEINGVAVSNTNTTILPGTADRYTVMQAIDIDTTTNIAGQALMLEVQGGNPTAGNSPFVVGVIYKIVWAGIGVEP